MKKGLFLFASMLFAAAIAVSCGNKNTEEEVNAEDSTAVEEATVTETNVDAAAPAVNKEEILSKAREAGRAKCNC